MKITLVISLLFSAFLSSANAQNPVNAPDTGKVWHTEGSAQISFSQVSLTNWQGGGQNLIAGVGLIDALARYKKDKGMWENKLHIGYGLMRQGKRDEIVQKSDDDIRLSSLYAHKLTGDWNYVGAADFQSTITPGYKYRKDSADRLYQAEKLSQFMSPGYLLLTAGAEYRPSEKFYLMLAPLSGKLTFVTDDSLSKAGVYGLKPGEKLRTELGVALKSLLLLKVMKNIDFQSDLRMFGNYKTLDRIDIDWLAGLVFNINDYVNAKVNTHLVYDDDIKVLRDNGTKGPAVQFKEVLAIGIQYKFH